jgi:ornithine cyclodeaminase
MGLRWIGADELAGVLTPRFAVRALRAALAGGLDPEEDPARQSVPVPAGELLLMPSHSPRHAGVKLVSVAPGNADRGLPRIQGGYLLFDGGTLAPVALLDGIALTDVRTAAVSALAADLLAAPDAGDLVVFGTGPQAYAHVAALRAVRPLRNVTVVGRNRQRLDAFVEHVGKEGDLTVRPGRPDAVREADLVACCTTATAPLFDGAAVPGHCTVVAVGSHHPDARETDDALVDRADPVVVESRASALREAGDIILPVRAGLLDRDRLRTLAELVADPPAPGRPLRPRFFKSTGMAWEDLVLAGAAYEELGREDAAQAG